MRRRPRSGSPCRSSLVIIGAALLVAPVPVRSAGRRLRDRRDRVVRRRASSSRSRSPRSSPCSPLRSCFGLLDDRRQAVTGLAIALGAAGVVTLNDPNQSWSDFAGARPALQHLLARRVRDRAEARAGVGRTGAGRAARARTGGRGSRRGRRGARPDRARAPRRRRSQRERDDRPGERRAAAAEPGSGAGARGARDRRADRPRGAGRDAAARRRPPPTGRGACACSAAEPSSTSTGSSRRRGSPACPSSSGSRASRRSSRPGVDLTAYRLVQEGLTNAIKHARASKADVVVRYGDGSVEVIGHR